MKEKDGFWAIPKEIAERTDIPLEARFIYGILWTRRNGENIAWPSQQYIAEKIGISIRSVRRHIQRLEKEGLVQKERQGLRRTNRYFLIGQIVPSREDTSVPSREDTALSHPSLGEDIKVREQSIAAGGTAAPWTLEEKLREMESGKRRDMQVLALYYRVRDASFENSAQLSAAIRRDIRAAQKLVGYSDERITKVTDWLDVNADFKWTLETVHKYIDEDLRRLEKPRELVRIRS